MFTIVDTKTHMLWLFYTANKHPPIDIVHYVFTKMMKEGIVVKSVQVDEDGALVHNSEFIDFLWKLAVVNLETTEGYNIFLNGEVEHHNHTIADMVHSMLINSGHSTDKWCYATETAAAADTYHCVLHSAIDASPYYKWYKIVPSVYYFHVWGCHLQVKDHDLKKAENCMIGGFNMGFTKSHLLTHWWDPIMNKVKHAFAVHFEEYHVCMSESDKLSPGSMLLLGETLPTTLLICEIDLSDHTHLASSPFQLTVELPPKGQMIGL